LISGGIFQVLVTGVNHNPHSAKLQYHLAVLMMKQQEKQSASMGTALEQLENFVLSFYIISKQEGQNADPNRLFS
jgi:hypothetical protein